MQIIPTLNNLKQIPPIIWILCSTVLAAFGELISKKWGMDLAGGGLYLMH